jgi:hypothetical protein
MMDTYKLAQTWLRPLLEELNIGDEEMEDDLVWGLEVLLNQVRNDTLEAAALECAWNLHPYLSARMRAMKQNGKETE